MKELIKLIKSEWNFTAHSPAYMDALKTKEFDAVCYAIDIDKETTLQGIERAARAYLKADK